MCALRWCFWENFCPQVWHSKGLTFMWTAETCLAKWSFLENLFMQVSHCQFPGLVTNSIFYSVDFLQSRIGVKKVRFQQTQDQGLRQLLLMVS